MSVLIHPTACSPGAIEKIQLATGMRAVIGKTFGHLVQWNGKAPQMRTTKPTHHSVFDHGPFGGNAA